jgi:hypothetical protein
MIPLFGEPEAGGKRDTLEGRFIWLAIEALQLGTSVVLDFGVWSRDERSLLRWLAGSVGASCEVVYVQVDRATQRERIWQRWTRTPQETFVMADAEIDTWRAQFQVPDDAELGGKVADPPEGWRTWFDWAARRWPSEISQLSPDGASPARPGVRSGRSYRRLHQRRRVVVAAFQGRCDRRHRDRHPHVLRAVAGEAD